MAEREYFTEGSAARQLNYDSRTSRSHSASQRAGRAGAVRSGYGTAVGAEPARPIRREAETSPERKQGNRPGNLERTSDERRALAARRAESKALANAQIRYTTAMVAAVVIAVALCCYLLKLTSEVKAQKEKVSSLKSQVATQLDENASYSAGLDSMTDLDEIYEIATTRLGMVYSQPGQTLYYSQNKDDYVVQYKDVPEAK